MELLLDRVAALAPQLELDDRGRQVAARLCRQVGDVPLAIELVARRVPQLGLRDVERLVAAAGDDPGAPTSLAAAVGWSLDLLLPADRDVFAALSVFDGPFELATAIAVVADGAPQEALVGAVVRLVEASLVTVEPLPNGDVRHRMLEPLRELARRRLDAAGDGERVRTCHAEVFRRVVVEEAARARGPDEAAAFARLDGVMADVRGAMTWLADRGDGTGVATIAAGLTRWWYARFLGWEGQRWIARALALGVDPAVRPATTWSAGFLAYVVHDYDEADARFREALALAEDAGDHRAAGDALYGLGRTHLNRVLEDGRALLARAEALLADDPDRTLERAECVLWQGLDDAWRGDPQRGAQRLREAAAVLAAHGFDRQESKARRWTAHAERRCGDLAASAREAEAAERLARRSVDQPALSGALIERAHVHLAAGDPAAARAALAEALRPIPADHPLDLCAVYTGVVCVLADDRPELALAVCGHVDAQYARARRRPLAEEVEVAAVRDGLRHRVGPAEAARAEDRGRDLTVRAMREEVTAALAG